MSGLFYLDVTVTRQVEFMLELVQRWELSLVWRSRPFLAVAEMVDKEANGIAGGRFRLFRHTDCLLMRSAASWKKGENVSNIRYDNKPRDYLQ
jgi:hypothetical protein